MKNFLDKFFSRSKNLDYISQNLKQITLTTPANKIFEAINNFSEKSEIRYVGGCVRKVIKKENVDDIDLATNLTPLEVCEALKKKGINYYETGIEHGTITAIIDEYKYEITSLRKDISTDFESKITAIFKSFSFLLNALAKSYSSLKSVTAS